MDLPGLWSGQGLFAWLKWAKRMYRWDTRGWKRWWSPLKRKKKKKEVVEECFPPRSLHLCSGPQGKPNICFDFWHVLNACKWRSLNLNSNEFVFFVSWLGFYFHWMSKSIRGRYKWCDQTEPSWNLNETSSTILHPSQIIRHFNICIFIIFIVYLVA
jgi:hypothetical protein